MKNKQGIDIFEEEWDNLLILDACRYDTFVDIVDLPGRTEFRISQGAATYEFIRQNFENKTLHDTVYVGGNTWFLKLRDDINAEIHDFLDLQHGDTDVEFAVEELDVPKPKSVTNAALKAHERYPNKRLIVHYLQPHHPFIGQQGREWFSHQSSSLTEVIDQTPNITQEKVQKAYRENLELVLPEIEKLISELPGRTVITADHGEMLGDRHQFVPFRDYGHHEGIYNDELIKVPWHIVEREHRKQVVEEPPQSKTTTSKVEIDKRLRDLGYKI
ncbi:hypothetical protein [Halorhabdus utahensis]|uniref:hypothetical protein n=1 Tax=Halorhabdus utahensis TaxID=146826 RepID=UPI001FDF7050|nr:hypothetical protein [Halorhabdus utahensis]